VTELDPLLSQQVLALPPSKAQKRQIQIVEAAIEVFAEVGIEKATYDKIAKICGVTRPLIQHYFPDKEILFELVIKYIRGHFQAVAIRAIEGASSDKERLVRYILSTFQWQRESPDHVKVWMLFFYLCGSERYRRLNTELVAMGQERIAALLERGTKAGVFRSRDFSTDAKMIQTTITGALVSLVTEDFPIAPKVFERKIVDQCLAIVGAKAPGGRHGA